MKLVTLNAWGGRIHKPLLDFFVEYIDVDIFCLQEIYHKADKSTVGSEYYEDALNLHTDITNTLVNHNGYFRPSFGECYGLSIFVKKEIKVMEEGDIRIYDVPGYNSGANHPRNLQWVKIESEGKNLTVVNVHGLWNGNGKTDTEDRLKQSENIISFLKTLDCNFVLCGDFNLLPDTESLKKFEEFGLRNLIKENNVTSTRTSLYPKELRFADYIFVSAGVKVNTFKVLSHEVSDHCPILVEFE